MPQMAPLNWLTLMIYFMMIMIMFNYLNYFSFMYNNKNMMKKKITLHLNWKW
uniref:ATP synthase complex subunit 8 n=1 Tax=Usechus lacerta TaxID=296008 RepID=A0A343A3S6_9CUCU|nr:ATP synthase F0 subunit 8 [Usechus lacerta]AOY39204.1 ATP synthase F0 subunit 8 [Usechus lacerta]